MSSARSLALLLLTMPIPPPCFQLSILTTNELYVLLFPCNSNRGRRSSVAPCFSSGRLRVHLYPLIVSRFVLRRLNPLRYHRWRQPLTFHLRITQLHYKEGCLRRPGLELPLAKIPATIRFSSCFVKTHLASQRQIFLRRSHYQQLTLANT